MIVKIPVYFETEEKLNPSQVSELTQLLQAELTSVLHKGSSNGNFVGTFFGKRMSFKLLTWTQVKNRVTKLTQ
jgi:hypothetical protein